MRSTLLVLPLAGLAALAGCGGDSGKPTSDTSEQQGLRFARCMREHGIDMPDPQTSSSGERTFRVGGPGRGGQGPDPARLQAADKACRKYAPDGGKAPSAAEEQEMRDRALSFSRCMRSHGVDFPDPQFSPGSIRVGGPGAKFDPNSPSFKAAEKACQGLMGPPPDGGAAVEAGP